MSQKHSDYKIGDIIKGLQLISEPYKINGRKEYRVMVKCTMCNKEPSDYFDLSKPTVSKYLHAGTEIGICNYTPRKNQFA